MVYALMRGGVKYRTFENRHSFRVKNEKMRKTSVICDSNFVMQLLTEKFQNFAIENIALQVG